MGIVRLEASIGHRDLAVKVDHAVMRRASLEVMGDLPLGSEASGHKASVKVVAIPTCLLCTVMRVHSMLQNVADPKLKVKRGN